MKCQKVSEMSTNTQADTAPIRCLLSLSLVEGGRPQSSELRNCLSNLKFSRESPLRVRLSIDFLKLQQNHGCNSYASNKMKTRVCRYFFTPHCCC